MALVHVPLENELHRQIRDRMKALRQRGQKWKWETLIKAWAEVWLQESAAVARAPVVKTAKPPRPRAPRPPKAVQPEAPKALEHLPGCGIGARGCVPECVFFDPNFDG